MRHLLVILVIVLGVALSSAQGADQVDKPPASKTVIHGAQSITKPAEQSPTRKQDGKKEDADAIDWLIWRLLAPVVLGGIGAAAINIYWTHRSRKREAAGLILVLTAEFVTGFSRCVTYYGQSKKGEVSYSSLFVLSDASLFSKFATLMREADLVMAAISLKSHFFQIERHAEAASRCIMDAQAAGDATQRDKILERVRAEQGATIGFFLSPYGDIVQNLRLLINASSKIAKGPVAAVLQEKLEAALKKKETIDSGTVMKQASSNAPECE